jgi:hypothetical protein
LSNHLKTQKAVTPIKIYQLHFDNEHYDYFVPEQDLPISELRTFDGRSKQNEWTPLAVRRANWRKGMELSDAPCCIFPVFHREVLDALRPLIAGSVEELELVYSDGDYCVVNVIAVLDVIDYTKSKRIPCDEKQRILVFERYAFMDCLELRQHHIFKIVDEPQRWAFVSDVFKTIVESKGFTGFIFRLVWDSEISALPL